MNSIIPDPRAIHAEAIRTLNRDRSLFNNLITLYSKTVHHLSYALRVFHHHIASPNIVSWTALISAQSNTTHSFFHFISMLRHPILPNQRTLAPLLKTCAYLTCLSFGTQLHTLSLKLSLSTQLFAGSSLVNFYAKCRLPESALKVFNEISDKEEVCYSSIIVGLAQNSKSTDAIAVFTEMKGCNVGSTMYSISAVLRAVAEIAALEQCRILHCHAVVTGFNLNIIVGTALVDGYGKCGMVSDAKQVLDERLPEMNIIGWNAMMSSYAQQGNKILTLELFHAMETRGLVPDQYSFLALLSSLCNAGMADETEHWLNRMKVNYGLDPGLEHYTCLVGAMGRAGRLEEAERIAMTMPFEPDAAVWRALLSTCAYHGAPDMASKMSKRLIEINAHDDSAYVIIANAFSAAGRWDKVAEVRKLMRDGRVKKEGGRSWIEVKGKAHVFLAEDHKHEKTDKIYAKLKELMEKIEKLGYVPVFDEMLHEVEIKEKKEALLYHSEKLALAFGVLSGAAPPGKALRIVKNLRICRDCHKAFKYMSKVVEREIVVRDVNRYHIFSNGSCSCGDHW